MNFEFPCFDPVLLDIPGPVDLRWYGLSYVAGFLIARWILGRFARRGFLSISDEATGDLLFWCIVGVLVGGRLGYALFYDQAMLHPVDLVQIWKGGMSFHGGLLGVCGAFIWFAVKTRTNWRRLGDAVAMAVTPGIFLVRVANFVNGELYGRPTDASTFGAMRFPTDPVADSAFGIQGFPIRTQELVRQYACGHREWEDVLPRLATHRALPGGALEPVDWEALRPNLDWDAVKETVPFRHPSQLYEGLSEGLLLGLVLFALLALTRRRPLGPGAYGGLFLLGYGVARILLEFVRQPDDAFVTDESPTGAVFLGLTMGQTLSSVMVAAGLYFVFSAKREPRPAAAAGR